MKLGLAILLVFLPWMGGRSQSSGGVDHLYYPRSGDLSPVLTHQAYFTSDRNWYGEARYNYDELRTFSFYAGKTFENDGDFSWKATPLLGGLCGEMSGGSVGINLDLDFKKIFFSSQSQYSFSFQNNLNKYFFNWSELGYQATPWLYSGVALQQTNIYRTAGKVEPGCMIGFSIKNWTIPLYAFSPSNSERYFVLGLNYQWTYSRKKTTFEQVLSQK